MRKIISIVSLAILIIFIIFSSVIAQDFCPKCGKLLPISDELKYCQYCGINLKAKNPLLRHNGIGYLHGRDFTKKKEISLVFSPYYNYIFDSGFGYQINLIGMHGTESNGKVRLEEGDLVYYDETDISYLFPIIFKYHFFIPPFLFSPHLGVGLSYYRINELDKKGLAPLLNSGLILMSNETLQLVAEWRYFINISDHKFNAGFLLFGGSINW